MKPKPKNPLVKCTKCNGEGKTELSEEYMVVLRATAKMPTITAWAVGARIGWTGHITAMNGRLNDLMKMGFYTRHREGRTFVYKQIKY